jgi:hypothetical protein
MPSTLPNYSNYSEAIRDIGKLSESQVSQMLEAIEVADLNRLIGLFKKIDPQYSDLKQHLLTIANNYDYNYLQHLLLRKESNL